MSAIRTATGRQIFYDDVGNGPPLLLIPGMTSDRRGADARLARALAACHRVVIMDLRDSGESAPETGYYTMADLGGDAAALLESLDIGRTHVLGHSLGGMVALQMTLNFPERVDRLVLMSTSAHGERGHRAGEPMPPPAAWWVDDPVERVKGALPQLIGPDYLARLDEVEAQGIAESYGDNRATWAGMLRQEATQTGHDLGLRLGEIRVPTLIVHGDADPLVPLEHGQVLAAGIPGAELLRVPNVGHFPWVEQPDTVVGAILTFLGKER